MKKIETKRVQVRVNNTVVEVIYKRKSDIYNRAVDAFYNLTYSTEEVEFVEIIW